ncbi:HAD family hydrolase [Aquifex pyrophilus]
MCVNAVLFDLDGTLIDSAEDIALALKKTLKEIGLEEYYPKDIRPYIGGGVKALLERVLGDKFREEYVELFRKYYLENPVVYTRVYEGVPEVLEKLKEDKVKLAVVSNKLEELSREILRRLGIINYFEFIAGGDTFPEKKPSPLPVIKTLEHLGIEPQKAIIVGDTEADILSGKGAGTITALAEWGYVRLNSEKPDFVLKKPEDLLKILDSLRCP